MKMLPYFFERQHYGNTKTLVFTRFVAVVAVVALISLNLKKNK